MNKTTIEWVKNPDGTQGYTFNPITGCLNGCGYCYARQLANTRLKERYLANHNLAPCDSNEEWFKADQQYPFYPRFWPEKIKEIQPKKSSKYKGIFCCDMSDLFGIGVPKSWTEQILDGIMRDPCDRFYLLTKQPQNLAKFSPFPDNCWVGVSATDRKMFDTACYWLDGIKAKTKYISFEPLLKWNMTTVDMICGELEFADISWLIIGSQTKPYNPPKIEWVKAIVEAADKAGVPVFLKNNLKPLLMAEGWGDSIFSWLHDGKLRQEMPA